jgi:hypothetical protein
VLDLTSVATAFLVYPSLPEGEEGDSLLHSVGHSSRHSDLKSPQKAPQILKYPYMHLRLEVLVAGIREHVCRRDRAVIIS